VRIKSLTALLLTIGAIVVVYYLLGMGYVKERREQEALTSQITEVTQVLAQTPEPPQDMEQQLEAAKARLSAAERSFPIGVNSTQVIDTILKLAENSQVSAIPLVTRPWTMENVGGHDCYVFRLNIVVKGDFSQLLTYLNKLEKGDYKTLIVEDLSLVRATGQPDEGVIAWEAIPVTANLNLAIYSRFPTSD